MQFNFVFFMGELDPPTTELGILPVGRCFIRLTDWLLGGGDKYEKLGAFGTEGCIVLNTITEDSLNMLNSTPVVEVKCGKKEKRKPEAGMPKGGLF